MTAYTEKNFNACLDAISKIKTQRDTAVRVADALLRLEEEDYHDQMCDCTHCLMGKVLARLKEEIKEFQTRKPTPNNQPK